MGGGNAEDKLIQSGCDGDVVNIFIGKKPVGVINGFGLSSAGLKGGGMG